MPSAQPRLANATPIRHLCSMARSAQKHSSFCTLVYDCVRAIPAGSVVTYGDVAAWLAAPRAARAVGYALAAQTPPDVPWHRVINRLGEISVGGALWRPEEQLKRLRREGVKFDREGRCALERYKYAPSKVELRRWFREGEKLRAMRDL
jgi:methylated-DNA-protein-cysteine methyltransferase-like protein